MLISIILVTLALIGLFLLLKQVSSRSSAFHGDNTSSDSNTDREFLSDYYRPMIRMLDARELATARELTGIADSDYSRFRKSRIRSFRIYLKDMRCDFRRIEFKMRYLMLSASTQEADLVQRLNRLKADFQLKLLRVELELFLFRFGIGTVDVASLVAMLEQFEASVVNRPLSRHATASA